MVDETALSAGVEHDRVALIGGTKTPDLSSATVDVIDVLR